MEVKEYFHNIKCDKCGCLADEEMWHADKETVRCVSEEIGWHITNDNKHYCPECWEWDDNEEVIIKEENYGSKERNNH